MALDPQNSSDLEQLALKGLRTACWRYGIYNEVTLSESVFYGSS